MAKNSFDYLNTTGSGKREVGIDTEHNVKYVSLNSLEIADEESLSATAADTSDINEKDALELAQEVGLYEQVTDNNPVELDIAGEINKDEIDHRYT